jgi:prophage regulatory protein
MQCVYVTLYGVIMAEVIKRILRGKAVQQRVGLGQSSIYNKIKAGEFPKPIKISERAVGWLESEIEEWIAARIEEARS